MAVIDYNNSLRWQVADATALAAQTILESEIGKLCRQTDTVQIWKAIKAGSGADCWRLDMSDFRDGVAEVALTDAATIAWDMSQGNLYSVTLGGNRTLGAPTNYEIGKIYFLRVIQDSTHGRTLAYNAVYYTAGGALTVTAAAAGDTDLLAVLCVSATHFELWRVNADTAALA
jgi:hypothetical protein